MPIPFGGELVIQLRPPVLEELGEFRPIPQHVPRYGLPEINSVNEGVETVWPASAGGQTFDRSKHVARPGKLFLKPFAQHEAQNSQVLRVLPIPLRKSAERRRFSFQQEQRMNDSQC